ncbi:hypothetical protein HDU79_000153, partial [Rhizoclosmatium sp. JEL0117]
MPESEAKPVPPMPYLPADRHPSAATLVDSDIPQAPKPRTRLVRRQDASFLNRWTYSYVNEALRRGEKTQLGEEDWAENNDEDDAEILSTSILN